MGMIGWHLDTGATDFDRKNALAKSWITFAGSNHSIHFRLALLSMRFGGLRVGRAVQKRLDNNRRVGR